MEAVVDPFETEDEGRGGGLEGVFHQANDPDKDSGDTVRALKTADTLIENADSIDEFLRRSLSLLPILIL